MPGRHQKKKPSASHILRTHGFCLVPSKPETSTSSEVSVARCLGKAVPARPLPGMPPFSRAWPPPAWPWGSCCQLPSDGGETWGDFQNPKAQRASKPCLPNGRAHQAKHTAPGPARDNAWAAEGGRGRAQGDSFYRAQSTSSR